MIAYTVINFTFYFHTYLINAKVTILFQNRITKSSIFPILMLKFGDI